MASGTKYSSHSLPPLSDDTQKLMELLLELLSERKVPEAKTISPALQQDATYQKLYAILMDLRTLSEALGRGDLKTTVKEKGYVLSNLKALQSSLRHLTWQTRMVAGGDFTQKVDFLGDFSDSFNEMTKQLQNHQEQMQHLASCDALTQIPNRLFLDEFAKEAFEEACKNNTPLSMLMLDIDHFKVANDNYGHAVGDLVLKELGKLLTTQLRDTDLVARYGGEEFVVVLPGTDMQHALSIAQHLLATIQKLEIPVSNEVKIQITVSIGVSERHVGDAHYTQIINRSDKAMYLAKISGRNRVCEAK